MAVFVKASRRGKSIVKAYVRNKKSTVQRLESIMSRYHAAGHRMNALPGPSTGIYGTGHSRLDRAYGQASNTMRRASAILRSPKHRVLALAAYKKTSF